MIELRAVAVEAGDQKLFVEHWQHLVVAAAVARLQAALSRTHLEV